MSRFGNSSRAGARGYFIAIALMLAPISASAQEMSAGWVLKNLSTRDLLNYLSGMVEAFSYARYADGKDSAGAKCIVDWFYEREGTQKEIMQMFAVLPDYAPGAVMTAMIQKECGA